MIAGKSADGKAAAQEFTKGSTEEGVKLGPVTRTDMGDTLVIHGCLLLSIRKKKTDDADDHLDNADASYDGGASDLTCCGLSRN